MGISMATTAGEPINRISGGSSVVDFGIRGERIRNSAHVGYFWETQQEFAEAVRFLETGLRGSDYCLVFGHDDANKAVCQLLEARGFNVRSLQAEGRIGVVGGNLSAEKILQTIGSAFSEALSRGAPLIRLLGNIGWGKNNWPQDDDLLAFEAKVTDAAKQFPCVVVCMYDTPALAGHIVHHGGFETHPYLMIGAGPLRENPQYVPTELFLQRLETLATEIAERRKQDDALKRSEERFRSLFENSIDAVLLSTVDGTIEAANPEACRLFGRSEEEICAIGGFGLIDPADGRLQSLLEERDRTGCFRGELFYKRKDGSTFLGEVSSAFYQESSGARKAAVIIRDVTERNRVEEILRDITAGTAGSTGDEFFRSLVRHLAHALQVRYAFVAECTDETKKQVRMLAFWQGKDFGDNIEFPLAGTPCENVVQGDACLYPERLQALFPGDEGLVTLGAQSYAGVPLHNATGSILGHLVVMDDKPRVFSEQAFSFLKIFATRAGAELERKHAGDALRQSQERLRTLLDINNAIVTKLTRDELFTAISEVLARVIKFDRLALSLYDPESEVLRLVTYAGPYRRDDYTPIGRVLDLNDSPAGRAFLSQKPVLRRDLEAERETSSEERAYGHGFRSLCALPLTVRGRRIGAITVGSLAKNQYAEADAELLMEVGNQIAIAVDNMRAHEETEALKARFQAEAVYLQEEIKTEHNFEEIIGQSAPVRQLLRKLEQVAPTEATVLIQGETGTGKELLARAVHDRSRRKERPLVKVNCGSIPAGLVESELFGHEKGAFTGATQRRIGRFELANGGTIFLDEVTELPVDTQVKLLRVLQEGEFERVGSSQTIKVDVRVIAATNRDLKAVVKNGTFRSDLFYRLNVFPLDVPALRERKNDLPLLVNFFLSKLGKKLGKELRGVSQRSMDHLLNYDWPGNVRELQNMIERAVVLATGPIVHIDDSMMRPGEATQESTVDTLENAERHHIIRALKETNWIVHGKKGAAEILGINPSTLRSRMEKLGIKKGSLSSPDYSR
jgi:formate hydrogenlyase transcriptional activator